MNLAEIEVAQKTLATFGLEMSPTDAAKRRAIVDALVETRRLAGIKRPPDRVTELAADAVLTEDGQRRDYLCQTAAIATSQAKRNEYLERVRTRPVRWKALGKDQAGNDQPLTVGQFLRGVALFIEKHGGPSSDTGRKFGSLVKFVMDPESANAAPPESFEPETNRSSQLEHG